MGCKGERRMFDSCFFEWTLLCRCIYGLPACNIQMMLDMAGKAGGRKHSFIERCLLRGYKQHWKMTAVVVMVMEKVVVSRRLVT